MIKRIVTLVLVLGAAGVVWMLARPRPIAVDVATITRGRVRAFVEEEGKSRVADRFVVATQVAGRLRRVRLDAGDKVETGALVCEIDPLPLRSRIEEAQARIRALERRIEGVGRKLPKEAELERAEVMEESAKSELDVAQDELEATKALHTRALREAERVRTLVSKRSLTRSALDAVEAEEQSLRARVEAARQRVRFRNLLIRAAALRHEVLEAQLKDYEWEEDDYREQITGLRAGLNALDDDLLHTRVLAPIAGTVLRRFEESERVVPAGTPVLEIGDLDGLEVEADFLSEDVAHMSVGMPAEVFGRALGSLVVPAKITRIYPAAFKKISSLGVEQQRVTILVGFDGAPTGLGDRYRVEVRVILEEKDDVVLVPEGALFRHRGAWHAFVLRDGAGHLTKVETGLRDGRVREVVSGLSVGDAVVLHPDPALEDGARLETLP